MRRQFIYLFLLGSMLATITICAIYTMEGGRLDAIVYGRYTEWALSPFLFFGLFFWLDEEQEGK